FRKTLSGGNSILQEGEERKVGSRAGWVGEEGFSSLGKRSGLFQVIGIGNALLPQGKHTERHSNYPYSYCSGSLRPAPSPYPLTSTPYPLILSPPSCQAQGYPQK